MDSTSAIHNKLQESLYDDPCRIEVLYNIIIEFGMPTERVTLINVFKKPIVKFT
jgi:hypothetical protein